MIHFCQDELLMIMSGIPFVGYLVNKARNMVKLKGAPARDLLGLCLFAVSLLGILVAVFGLASAAVLQVCLWILEGW